ncbi:FCD domain-containing protein [Entomohabitans teleogrylli]|uniref:FCD domain-containing protein n=1 Tax=Entomohabitans teleogrylli TaxID=1384589 RepID=UPI00073D779F|nr:FCD domain-containing protein [Entomohabitans teleogrylli]
MLELEKAQRMSLTMQVELRLKNALITGALKPGDRLITKEIAGQLGTSITPVREALLRLVSSGCLQVTPAQAFQVPDLRQERYREINGIRKNLETMAVTEAIKHITKEQLTHLQQLYQEFKDARENLQYEEALHKNLKFRFTLYSHARMPTLLELIEQLWMRIGPGFSFLLPTPDSTAPAPHDYDALLEAIAAKDSNAAIRALSKTIDESLEIFLHQNAVA